MINGSDINLIDDIIIKKLDTIDFLSEMSDETEPLRDFMDRLEEKYPFKITVPTNQSGIIELYTLFDAFSEGDFEYYLQKRYTREQLRISEYTRLDITKRIK